MNIQKQIEEIQERTNGAHLVIAKYGTDGKIAVIHDALRNVNSLLDIISQQTAEIEQLRSALDMIGIHNGTIDAFNEIEKILEGSKPNVNP